MRLSIDDPELWKKINWDEEFKNVKIIPNVEVEIVKAGSIY
ncbi:hypothetical protein ACOQFO_03395 [Ureibacillus sp. MALMAid1270]